MRKLSSERLSEFPRVLQLDGARAEIQTQVFVTPKPMVFPFYHATSFVFLLQDSLSAALQSSSHYAGPRALSRPKRRAWNRGWRCVSTHRQGQRFLCQTPRPIHRSRLTLSTSCMHLAWAVPFTYSIALQPHVKLTRLILLPHFTEEETEAKKGEVPFPKSFSLPNSKALFTLSDASERVWII